MVPSPATGAYSDLMKSFANWVTYSRKRSCAAVGAVGKLVTDPSFKNMLVGLYNSPPSSQTGKVGDMWINTDFNSHHYDYTWQYLGYLYDLPDSGSANKGVAGELADLYTFMQGGSPIANTNDNAWFTSPVAPTGVSYSIKGGNTNTYPYFTEAWGGSCQQAFALFITDGSHLGSTHIGNYDGPSLQRL